MTTLESVISYSQCVKGVSNHEEYTSAQDITNTNWHSVSAGIIIIVR